VLISAVIQGALAAGSTKFYTGLKVLKPFIIENYTCIIPKMEVSDISL